MANVAAFEARNQDRQMAGWNFASRIVFRFLFVYFGLFCITTQIGESLIPLPDVNLPDPSGFWPVRQIVAWTARHVFQVASPLVVEGSGSGDKTSDWVLVFCLLIVAGGATVAWSVIGSRREDYSTLYKWGRFALRFALAGQMLSYGFAKLVPLQMPFPYLKQLLEPYGNFSPMGVLWASIGSMPAYEIFAGFAETLGGILLLFPRTTMFGAFICIVDLIQIFMLNMTYDVPVKLFSFHLLLMAFLLIAPESRRIANFFWLNRAVGPPSESKLFQTRRANRVALIAQVAFGCLLIASNSYDSWAGWREYGGGREKSPLYGIWQVTEMSINGQIREPLFSDWSRFRRAIFDFPQVVGFQRPDDSFASYGASIDTKRKTITFTGSAGQLAYQRIGSTGLIIDGSIEGKRVHMDLQRMDRSRFLLVTRGFHWVQEYPYNR